MAWWTKFVDISGDVCKIYASVQTAVILYCFKVVHSGLVLVKRSTARIDYSV